jgi:hypothetical protein
MQIYLNNEGKPVLLRQTTDEWGYSSYRVKYDNYGNEMEVKYYGTENEPIMTGNQYHQLTCKYNARRQLLEIATFDTHGNPVLNRSGYARVLRKYDDRGNLIEIVAFDELRRLSEAAYGYARMTRKYDSRGNMTEEAYYGRDDKLKILPSYGYARHVNKYDEYGNLVEEAYYGSDNAPINIDIGYARVVRKYDTRRLVREERYFAADGASARIDGWQGPGQHITRYVCDSFGNVIEETYFGVNEEPVFGYSSDGQYCSRYTAKYDLANNLIDKKYDKEAPATQPKVKR